MNILHHKSWHVRTKANMQRVRRDEAKAAEEEQRILDRQIQAENERRIGVLRQRAEQKVNSLFGESSSEAAGTSSRDVCISDETGHVNLFQDLEREERKNLGTGNKEYEEEKAKEKREWESKMGIQVYFAENTNDLDKKKEWYETMPMRKAPDKQKTKKYDEDSFADRRIEKRKREDSDSEVEKKKKKKKHKKEKKKKKKHRKHRDSSEEREIEKEYEKEKRKRLEILRDERLKRERMESARTYALLHPEEIKREEQSKRPKYNSQFNPELARR